MKTTWHYRDIIDLEYFFHRDKDTDEDVLHVRDRTILLDQQNLPVNEKELSHHRLLRLWLSVRIACEFPGDEHRSPGTIFADAHLLAKNLAAFIGVLVGITGGLSFFGYTGATPVNVFHFLLLFVVSQLGLASLVGCGWLIRLLFPRLKPPSFYSLFFRGLIERLASFVHKQWLRGLAPDKRASFGEAFGIVKARSAVYGSLFYWPLFGLAQLFAIGFNIGLLLTTFVKIATSDLAFGWQSTLQVSGEALHRVVQLAAVPWSWLPIFGGTGGYPSLAEIEGSRIILKEGIYHLATQNLIAWWPFLVMCLIVYGLLLRLVLFGLGKAAERRALRGVDLDTATCLAVVRRMMTPLVSTQAPPEKEMTTPDGGALRESEPQPSPQAPHAPFLLPQVVLIPDDIFGLCPVDKLTPLLYSRGLTIKSVHKFLTGYEEDQELKTMLAESCQGPDEGLFILMEGWMPPLVAFLTYLKELRGILPGKTMIHLGLVGRPVRSGFNPLTPQQLKLWRKKLAAIGDPYLHTFSLIP